MLHSFHLSWSQISIFLQQQYLEGPKLAETRVWTSDDTRKTCGASFMKARVFQNGNRLKTCLLYILNTRKFVSQLSDVNRNVKRFKTSAPKNLCIQKCQTVQNIYT